MSSGPIVKTQLEMQEEKNRRMIEAEEQRWVRDQIHMEAQIRNTIEQTHAVKKTVERDQQRMRMKEENRLKMEAEKAKYYKERDEHMKSVLDTANKAKRDWINKEVRKFKKIQKDFATDLRESMDIWDNYKNDPEALAKHSLARLRKLNETYDPQHLRASAMNRSSHSAAGKSEKGKESSMSPDGEGGHNSSAKSGRARTPEYIRQRRKYEEHMNAKYSGNSKNAQELEQKIQELERKNRERDMIIAGHRQAVNEKMRSALSEIEKNQQEAAKKLKKKMEETVHVYVEKQIKGEEIRKMHSEKQHAELVAARKQFEERLKEAALRKVDEDKKKNKKLKLEQTKKTEKLQKMAVRKEEEARERHARSIERDQKIHTVLQQHEEIMEVHAQMGMQLMQGIREKAEKIEEKKRIELQMVEDRKKHLAELEKEKLHFKKMFGNFEVDEESQKRALERLKSYGIKSTGLKETIKRIEAEEAEKLKAKNKKNEEEET